jgi:hypothetical protein
MATRTRERAHRGDDPVETDRRDREDDRPEREGDVLGISDSSPGATIPQHRKPGGGRPRGLEVRDHATGIGDLERTPGATGIDMGAGGEGTHISEESKRPRTADVDDTD